MPNPNSREDLTSLVSRAQQAGWTPSMASALADLIPSIRRDASGVAQALQWDGTDIFARESLQVSGLAEGVANEAANTAALRAALLLTAGYLNLPAGNFYLGSGAFTGLATLKLRGAGQHRTVIKLKDNANLAALFTFSAGATKIRVSDLTFDANGANQNAHSAFMDLATNAPTDIRVERCTFQGLRGTGGATGGVGAFNIGGQNFTISFCDFLDSTGCHFRMTDAYGGCVERCYFTGWSPDGANSSVLLLGGASMRGVSFVRNRWLNTYAGKFCIESVPTGTVYHANILVDHNIMDGNGLRGTGVSGFISDSLMRGNILMRGGDDATLGLQRNGFELWGTRTTVEGNFIENGAIVFSQSGAYANGSFNKAIGNTIQLTQAVTTSCFGIAVRNQDDITIADNDVSVSLSGSATMQSALYIGTFGTSGTINRARVHANKARLATTATGNGIRVLTSTSTDIDLYKNEASGFSNGLNLQSNSNDTNLRLQENVVWNNTTPVTGSPTGTGFVDKRNIRFTGQYGTQAVASSAAPALNCGAGDRVTFTATQAATWGAPSNIPLAGDLITVTITQDATGGWAISWNAAYVFPTAFSNTGNTANKKTTVLFVSNGSKLIAQGANSWY